jgi:hypothetical protein
MAGSLAGRCGAAREVVLEVAEPSRVLDAVRQSGGA